MTSECARTLEWAGGQHTLNLDQPWVRSIISHRGFPGENGNSPAACLRRFQDGLYTEEDVARVLELGLIGGGKTRSEASALIDKHVRTGPLAAHAVVAFEVLAALFVGQGA